MSSLVPNLSIYINFPGESASYTHRAAIKAASKVLHSSRWSIIDGRESQQELKGLSSSCDDPVAPCNHSVYFCDYDLLPFDHLSPSSPSSSSSSQSESIYPIASSYFIRKALIRKHYLAHSIHSFAVKQPTRVQRRIQGVVPKTWRIELQFADELDELLVDDLWDLQVELTRNEQVLSRKKQKQKEGNGVRNGKARQMDEEVKWFILKPGMADRGNGIRLFSTLDELVEIFQEFQDQDESDEDEDEDGEAENEREENQDQDNVGNSNKFKQGKDTSVMMSQLRHFVIQEYISKPLLVHPPSIKEQSDSSLPRGEPNSQAEAPKASTGNGRKFHLRAYVLCVGGLSVYLFDDILALFASLDYELPDVRMELGKSDEVQGEGGEAESKKMVDLRRHLTNTCLQEDGTPTKDNRPEEQNVHLLDDLVDSRIFCPNQAQKNQSGEEASSFDSSIQTNQALTSEQVSNIKLQCCQAIGDTFMAAAKAGSIHWQIWPNCFEIFGVDLLVGWDDEPEDREDASQHEGSEETDSNSREQKKQEEKEGSSLKVWLLEINAQPDFAQTGTRLSSVVERLFVQTLKMVVPSTDLQGGEVGRERGRAGGENEWKTGETRDGMTLCYTDDLGRG